MNPITEKHKSEPLRSPRVKGQTPWLHRGTGLELRVNGKPSGLSVSTRLPLQAADEDSGMRWALAWYGGIQSRHARMASHVAA